MRVTSRKIPRDWRGSGETNQTRHEIRVDGKLLGCFNEDTGKFRLTRYRTEEELLADPADPCEWKWVVLKKTFAAREDVVAWVKAQWEEIRALVYLHERG
ncbi:MAG: hypothetical protein FWH26_08330 [Oscillospiraceae bacterium]|nr:hypothetical protein [Oscillospiraceae bacterium]